MGHISEAPALTVFYEVPFVSLDSMIFSATFRKSGNCMVTTITHIVGNAAGYALIFALA